MKRLLLLALSLAFPVLTYADPLVWQTPYGRIGLPFESTEIVLGYGAIAKQAIGGFSLPVYTDPKGIITLQVGAVSPWPVQQGTAVQPYIAAGHDILREIPVLKNYQSVHLNVFARYITDANPTKADVGIAISYAPIQAATAPISQPPAPEVPQASKLNLLYAEPAS